MPLATPFPGLVVEGAFFPPDAIEALAPRVALAPGKRKDKSAAQAFLPGFLDPAGYTLPPGIDIDEKAQQEFSTLKKVWREFDRHRANAVGNWSRYLFQALGYGLPNPVPGLEAAGQLEGHDGTVAVRQVLGRTRVPRARREAGVVDLRHLGSRLEPLGHGLRVLRVALHAQAQGLEALEHEEGVERRDRGAEVAHVGFDVHARMIP